MLAREETLNLETLLSFAEACQVEVFKCHAGFREPEDRIHAWAIGTAPPHWSGPPALQPCHLHAACASFANYQVLGHASFEPGNNYTTKLDQAAQFGWMAEHKGTAYLLLRKNAA